MATTTDNNIVIPQTDVSAAISSQSSALTAEAENIRRLQREVYCITSTLHAIGKKNRCSKEWITLKSKLDAAQEELNAVLEDHQLLKSISLDSSHDLLSTTLSFGEEQQLQEVPSNSPTTPTTLMLSHELQHLKDQLKDTPKWSLRWFEIKKQIDTETKRCELQTLKEEYDKVVEDNSRPIKLKPTPQKKENNPTVHPDREPLAPGNLKIESIESIFRPMTPEMLSSNNVERTRTTSCSSVSHANIYANDSKQLDVTITVISVDGLIARRYEPKSKLPTQWKKNDIPIGDKVTIVASFSQVLSGKEFLTHLPSDPIEVETSVIPTKPFPQQLVEWPDLDDDEVMLDDDNNNIELSTYQFSREFQLEKQRDGKSSAMRFIPQTCPINISMSRHGKLLSLGKANLVITGEERGASSVAPITINYRNSKVKNMKKILKGSKSIPMVRMQGDNIQFGLKSDAMLRVLVSVRQGRASTQIPTAINMKQQPAPSKPATVVYNESSGNDYEYEDVEDHQDEPGNDAEEARVASNLNATTENFQIEHKIERMKAHIKTLNNNIERNVEQGQADNSLKLAITELEQQNKELAERLASISEEKNQLECSLLKEKKKTKSLRRKNVASDREKQFKDNLTMLSGGMSSQDVQSSNEDTPGIAQKTNDVSGSATTSKPSGIRDSNQADKAGGELPTRTPKESDNMSYSDVANEMMLRYKDSANSDDGSSNSDDSLATSMLNDVYTRAAAVLAMNDKPHKKPVFKSSPGVDNLLLKVCTYLNFDIAEVWLHEGNNYHLINSHVRPVGLNESMCNQLLEVYHGEGSCERTHRLSLSMCKWAKKTGKILWIIEHQTPRLAQALKYSISGVQLAVAVPVYHEGVYATIIYFSMTSTIMEPFAPGADEYLTKMSDKVVTMANVSSRNTT
jgi:hypothetical protein